MAIISTVFGSLLGIPFVTDILKGVAELGYKNLKDKNKVYKLLAEKGIEKPTDDNKSLYIHSLILLNFQINDPNYLQVLISEESFAVFESSVIQKRREEPFIIHVNQELLSILSHDDPDDAHRPMSEKIVKEFIKIYDGLVLQVATPVQNNILNSLDDINQGNTEIKAGIAMIISRLDDKEEDSPIVKSQISFINGFIETRKFELGVEGLRNLEKNLDQIKSLDLRSNILVNLGYCLHELGKKEEAKVYFKKAYEVNDKNFGALCNYSQALVDEGNYELGEELVQKAVDLYGDKLPQVWEAYILIKRRKISLEELIKDIPKNFIENANIQRILGIVYRTLGKEDSYLYHIKKAYEIDPDNADTRFSYIESIVYKYQVDYRVYNLRSFGIELKLDIEKHLDLVQDFINHEIDATEYKLFYHQAKLTFLYLLNRLEEALEYFEIVLKEFEIGKNKLYQLKTMLLYVSDRADDAISFLELHMSKSLSIEELLMHMDMVGRKGIINKLEQSFESLLVKADENTLYQGLSILIDSYIAADRNEELTNWAERIKKYEGLDFRVIEAKILFYLGSLEFDVFLLKCEGQITPSTRFSIINIIITLYEASDNWEKAASLLEAQITVFDYDYLTERLLFAIEQWGNIEKLVNLLENLRLSKGIHHRYTVKECNYYFENYLYTKAIAIAREYINAYPDRVDMELFVALINFRIGNLEEVDLFLEREVNFDNLRKEDQNNYLVMLATREKSEKCLDIIYEYHRKNYTPYSNDLYLTFWLKFDLISHLIQPQVASINTVVVIFDGGRERRTFLIVDENSTDIQARRFEVSADSTIIKLLMDRPIGFEFILDNELIPKKWTIESIENKYLFQLRKCQEDASGVFKSEGGVKAYHIDDIIAMIGSAKDRIKEEDPLDRAFEYYKQLQVGLGTLSEGLKENIVSVRDRVMTKNIEIMTSFGFSEESYILDLASENQEIVFDVTSILTLHDLGILDLVPQFFSNVSISHSTFEDLEEFYQQHCLGSERLKIFEKPVLKVLKEKFSIKFPNMLSINKFEKKKFYSFYGRSLYDSAILAKENNAVLFSDDFFSRTRCSEKLQLKSCWIVPFLKYLRGKEVIDKDFYQDKIIRLLTLRYRFIEINAGTLYYSLERNNFAITDEFINLLPVLSGKVSSVESAVETFFVFIDLLLLSQNFQIDDVARISDLMFSHLVIERDLSIFGIQYEDVVSRKSRNEKQYFFMMTILNKYSLQFGFRLKK